MPDGVPDVDRERLSRRVAFLLSRARAHIEGAGEGMLHHACAATLLRDAACVALLLGETRQARNHLREAGHQFLRLGLAAGSTLIALAETRTAQSELAEYSDVIEGTRDQWSRTEAIDHGDLRRPMAAMARGSPRQMFSLMQTEWLVAEIGARPWVREGSRVRTALERNGGYPVGETGVSIDSYIKIADWMIEHSGHVKDNMPSFVGAGMATLAATRAEHIRAAMKDTYHWRMLTRPTELLDLDSVVLMFIAVGAGINQDALEPSPWADVPLHDAPLRAALRLRSDQELQVGRGL